MKRAILSGLATAALIAGGMILLQPDPATAQPYLCQGQGPGPDEVVVGTTPGGPGQPNRLLCARKGSGSPQGSLPPVSSPQITMSPRIEMPPLYGIHVMDADKGQLYSANQFFTAAEAETTALGHCRRQSGKACSVIGTFADACQGVAIGPAKQLYKGQGNTPRLAWRASMAACMAEHPASQCSMWRIPLCSGALYGDDVFHAGANNLPPPDEVDRIKARITAEVVAEIEARK